MYVMMSCGGSSGSERWTSCPRQPAEVYDRLPLRDAVERLPQELRAVVALRYFAGYTLAETAEILGIPPGDGVHPPTPGTGAAAAGTVGGRRRSGMNRNEEYNTLLRELDQTPPELEYTVTGPRPGPGATRPAAG